MTFRRGVISTVTLEANGPRVKHHPGSPKGGEDDRSGKRTPSSERSESLSDSDSDSDSEDSDSVRVDNMQKVAKVASGVGKIYTKLGGKALEKGLPMLRDALQPTLKMGKTAWQETVELAEVVVPAVPKLIQGASQGIVTREVDEKRVKDDGRNETVTAEVVPAPKQEEEKATTATTSSSLESSESTSASSLSSTTTELQETVTTEEVVTRTEVTTEMKEMRMEETLVEEGTVIKKKKEKKDDE